MDRLNWGKHIQHKNAVEWEKKSLSTNSFLFCRFTMLGFIRLLTSKSMMAASTVNVTPALKLYDRWLEDPRVRFRQEPRGIDDALRRILEYVGPQTASQLVADCYLAAFAQAGAATLLTFDTARATLCKNRNVAVELLST